MPKVLAQVGYDASEIGIIFAAGPLVRFALPFLFMRGFSLDKMTFRVALVIMVVSALAFYLSLYDFYLLLFSNIFLGVGMSLVLPYIEIVSLETIGKERYGKVRLFGSIGFILVALVLVRLLSEPSVALNFLFAMVCITALVAFIIAEQLHKKEMHTKEKLPNDVDLLKDYKLWGSLIMMQMSFGSFYNFFTIYVTNNGISLDMAIYLWSFGVVIEIIMLYFQGKLLQGNLLFLLQVTTFASIVRWFLLFAYPSSLEMLFFTQSIHALSFALFHSAAISYLFHLYKNRTLSQQFFSGITYGLGGLVGALVAGYIYEYLPEYLFLSSALMALGSFVLIYMWSRDKEKQSIP